MKVKRTRKDKHPKQAKYISAYHTFFQREKQKMLHSHYHLKPSERVKIIASNWRNLDTTSRCLYEENAREEMKRQQQDHQMAGMSVKSTSMKTRNAKFSIIPPSLEWNAWLDSNSQDKQPEGSPPIKAFDLRYQTNHPDSEFSRITHSTMNQELDDCSSTPVKDASSPHAQERINQALYESKSFMDKEFVEFVSTLFFPSC